MYKYLDKINGPMDVKKLTVGELASLSAEIREFLVESVSRTGGHLASNLGVVELTLSLFQTFNPPRDKIVWDVGHQTYVHKLLTGRREQFGSLRTFGGISGFPKASESEYDAFNTGHSSTSISAAYGMATARDLAGDSYYVVAVIGDGALTGGMAFEALNDAGFNKRNFIVILNDNEMSISRNVGSMSQYLTKIRSKPLYFKFKADLERVFRKIPGVGEPTVRVLKKVKDSFRHMLTNNTIFEDLGFTYLGPIDGHNISLLSYVMESAKRVPGPVLIHILTKKGKGYKFAEEQPTAFHGVSKFHIDTGKAEVKKNGPDYSQKMGEALIALAQENERVCAITAAMPSGTGLTEFSRRFPSRSFDVGIAEQHAVTFSAGLSKSGFVPVLAVYSSFLQRAYDQVLHDVCLQNLHVVFCIDRAGLVGADGETHQGLFDIAFLSAMPNMALLAPANFSELEEMLAYAVKQHNGPIAIRYPRGGGELCYENALPFAFAKPDTICTGTDICILCAGSMCRTGETVSRLLKEEDGLCPSVINLRTLLPLDEAWVASLAAEYSLLVTLEDGVRRGGVGEYIAGILQKAGSSTKLLIKAHTNPIVPHGSTDELYRLCGLDAQAIADDIRKLRRKGAAHESAN